MRAAAVGALIGLVLVIGFFAAAGGRLGGKCADRSSARAWLSR